VGSDAIFTSPNPENDEEYDVPNHNQNQDKQGSGNQSKGRGFAGMDPTAQREIASEGGRAAHASGHAHEFTSEEARKAGRKGGEARSQSSRSQALSRAVQSDRDIQDRSQGAGAASAANGSASSKHE
jgi:general stress protein YciG